MPEYLFKIFKINFKNNVKKNNFATLNNKVKVLFTFFFLYFFYYFHFSFWFLKFLFFFLDWITSLCKYLMTSTKTNNRQIRINEGKCHANAV